MSLHRIWNWQTSEIDKCGSQIDVGDQLFRHAPCFDSGTASDQRSLQTGLVHKSLVVESEITEVPAIVGGVHDDGVLGEPVLIEIVQNFSDAVINTLNAGEVVLHVSLILPVDQIFAGQCFAIDRQFHRLCIVPLSQSRAL